MTTITSGVPFWETSPEVFGSVQLGKHMLRGVKDVSIKRGRKRDTKSAPGKNGAKLGSKGFESAKVKITWHVCTVESSTPSERWDAAAAILRDLEDKKQAEQALAIVHPFCAIRGIDSVTLDDIEGPNVVEGSGLFSFVFDCTEYTTPTAAKKGGKGGGGVAGVPFDATYVLIASDTGGATSTGKNVPVFGKIVEPTEGVYREAKSGKAVKLLDIPATATNPEKLTPRELDKRLAKIKSDAEAGIAPGTTTSAPVDGNAYANPGAVGGDIGVIEDADIGTQAATPGLKKAKTEAGDLAP